jgi:hypothetical protein
VLRETTSRGLCGLVCPSRTHAGVYILELLFSFVIFYYGACFLLKYLILDTVCVFITAVPDTPGPLKTKITVITAPKDSLRGGGADGDGWRRR